MIHVWIVPHECGPFALLEGVGAGSSSKARSAGATTPTGPDRMSQSSSA